MRLFVALDVPDDVRASLSTAVSKLRATAPKARWVRIEGLHLTLKFIGETPAEKAGAVRSALSAVRALRPIVIRFRGLGFFPNPRRPRVFWAGVEAGPELADLAGAVDAALHPLGIPREERAFAPHLTLARFDPPHAQDALYAAIEKSVAFEFGTATARQFHVYQSVLKPGGAEYTRLASFPLRGSESE
jgi:RNA 2',3'-cyclic 3'-phosphodiesterase